MRLSQIVDKDADQDEVKSKYLFVFHGNKTIHRINLVDLTIDFSKQFSESLINCMMITNNKIFGVKCSGRYNNLWQLFILDEYFNIKIIETSTFQPYANRSLSSCFYGDSIFIYERTYSSFRNRAISHHAKRYSISQNSWIHFLDKHIDIYSCIGFKQKLIIISHDYKMVIYDINLDLYIEHSPINKLHWSIFQMMIKKSGKLYLIAQTEDGNKIYFCDDPLSEWTFICDYNDTLLNLNLSPYTYYNGSIYYFTLSFCYLF